MIIYFYIHIFDLDQLNKILKSYLLDLNKDNYVIEIYTNYKKSLLQNNYILTSISYEDYMRIQEYLDFK